MSKFDQGFLVISVIDQVEHFLGIVLEVVTFILLIELPAVVVIGGTVHGRLGVLRPFAAM